MRLQVSLEFLIILSVTLIALLVFMTLTQSERAGLSSTKIRTESFNTVKTLGAAAGDVYAQGKGAKKKVLVDIPFGYMANESLVGNKAIKLHAAGNDFVETTGFEVYGYLPQIPGKHEVWVESEGDKVKIGSSLISVDREAINLIMRHNDTRSDSFTVSNLANSTVTVSIIEDWNNPNVSMIISSKLFALGKASSSKVDLDFLSSADSRNGFYTGYLNITGSDGSRSDSIILPLNVEVSRVRDLEGGPPLVVLPSIFQARMKPGESEIKAFQVCTNSETTLTSVEFIPSEEEPGPWAGMTEPLPGMGSGMCLPKSISVNVPEDAEPGNWKGYIYLSGHGAPGPEPAEDVIVLHIDVEGLVNKNDTQGPLITDVTVFPSMRKIFVSDLVAVRVTADDRLRGNNSISGCELNVDGGAWIQMDPSDKVFDEPLELASHVFFSGFPMGEHSVAARCTDANNNTGPEAHANFSIYNELLFVTEGSIPSSDESAWMGWLDGAVSPEAYSFSYESIDAAAFIAGYPNTSYYTALVAERWVPGMGTEMNAFESSGGSIVLLGYAVLDAPRELQISAQTGTIYSDTDAVITDGSHYITSGQSGTVTIMDSPGQITTFWKDLIGAQLAKSTIVEPPHWHILGISGKKYFWGPTDPSLFNEVGDNMSVRVFDHALNASSLG